MGHHVTPKGIWEVLKSSFKGFGEDKITKLSASLAYYTIFSLAPLLIMVIYLCGIFMGREAIEGTIYTQIDGFVGREAAIQIQGLIKSVALDGKGGFAMVVGVVTLLIGATTVFAEIQDSINSIWGLKPKPKLGLLKLLKDRLLSFGIIGSLGFLLIVSLGVSAVVDALGNRLKDTFPDITVVVFYVINILLTLTITSGLFGVIFKVLPDARIKWKDVLGGAIATSILFMIGKLLISLYISKADVGGAFGAAGSLVILIVWIYYSAIILYFGAEFTKAYALKYGSEIHPSRYAVTVKSVVVEGGKKSVQEMDDVDQHNMPVDSGQHRTRKKHKNGPEQHRLAAAGKAQQHALKKQYMSKPDVVYDAEHPPLGMFDLVQALGLAVIMKVADLGKREQADSSPTISKSS